MLHSHINSGVYKVGPVKRSYIFLKETADGDSFVDVEHQLKGYS